MADDTPHGVVLIGLSGSGKTTVGCRLAARLGRPFVDTDELCRRMAGAPVPQLIGDHGEAAFREIEGRAVAHASTQRGAVIAAGGGAVIDPLNRWRLWEHGVVVWLSASVPTLSRRLADDPQARPLIASEPTTRLAQLLAERAAFYRAADLLVDAEAEPDSLVAAVADTLERQRSWPPPGRRLFDAEVPRLHPVGPPLSRIVYGHRLDRRALDSVVAPTRHPAISLVVDRVVANRHPRLLAALPSGRRREIAAGEHAKRLRRVEGLLEWLADGGAERGAPLVAVGGGTLGDLVGTVAALYARGVPLVQVPTTWLAQADSAIGGKVAVDLSAAKNAAGAFWPPAAIVADTALIETMPLGRRRDGMAESIKAAILGDPALWRLIADRGAGALRDDLPARYAIIERGARVKLAICDRDPFEENERRTLNLGHTIGHALEVESGFRLSHGMAVSLGLRAVTSIAARRGADPDLAPKMDGILAHLGFPLRHSFAAARVREALTADKKRLRGRQRWILPMAVGTVTEVDDVADREIDRALRSIAA